MNIDLNNLNATPDATTTSTETGVTVSARTLGETSLESVYDANQKMVYILDVSGSMGTNVAGSAQLAAYDLKATEKNFADALPEARRLLEAFEARFKRACADEDADEDADAMPLNAFAAFAFDYPAHAALIELTDARLTGMADDMFWSRALEAGLLEEFGERDKALSDEQRASVAPKTRLRVLSEECAKQVRARREKYPNANIAVIAFGTQARALGASTVDLDADQLHATLTELYHECGGGTDIEKALTRAMAECKKRKSEVGLHHFVLVSDGESGFSGVYSWLQKFKEHGVVLDFIHISSEHCSMYTAKGLADLCAKTGGEYVRVSKYADLVKKFIAASTRLCLPPAPDAR